MIDNSNVQNLKEKLYAQLVINNIEINIYEQYIKDYNILLSKYLQYAAEYEKQEIIETCFGEQYNDKYKEIEIAILNFKDNLKTKDFTEEEKAYLLKNELANIMKMLGIENKKLNDENGTLKLTTNSHLLSIKQIEEIIQTQEKEIFELRGCNKGLKQENKLILDILDK